MVVAASGIPTYYRQRQSSCVALSRTLTELVSTHPGHYLIFFPSYEYLELVYQQFIADCTDVEIIVQSKEMAEEMREEFLTRFTSHAPGILVGFAVMGGIFGEGIDLKGDHLTGAAIVGVGLPGICPERELIRQYFDQVNGAGFAFAYQYPGITRVLQAAGRVIRSESDRGVVMLIDQRYASRFYTDLLPEHWQLQYFADPTLFQKKLSAFWGKSN